MATRSLPPKRARFQSSLSNIQTKHSTHRVSDISRTHPKRPEASSFRQEGLHRSSPLRSFQQPGPDYHSPRHPQDSTTRRVNQDRTIHPHAEDGNNRSVSFDAHRRQPTERHAMDEHTFHRERSFINRQFQQQQRAMPRENDHRYDPRRSKETSRPINDYQGDRAPRPYPGTTDADAKRSNDPETLERPRRYSNMRSNVYNTLQQQVLPSSKSPLNERSMSLNRSLLD